MWQLGLACRYSSTRFWPRSRSPDLQQQITIRLYLCLPRAEEASGSRRLVQSMQSQGSEPTQTCLPAGSKTAAYPDYDWCSAQADLSMGDTPSDNLRCCASPGA